MASALGSSICIRERSKASRRALPEVIASSISSSSLALAFGFVASSNLANGFLNYSMILCLSRSRLIWRRMVLKRSKRSFLSFSDIPGWSKNMSGVVNVVCEGVVGLSVGEGPPPLREHFAISDDTSITCTFFGCLGWMSSAAATSFIFCIPSCSVSGAPSSGASGTISS